jgi:hypothetical protein
MKAQKYIAATLMMMFIGISVTNGQRTVRTESKEGRETTAVRKPTTQNTSQQKARTTTVSRQPATVNRTATKTTTVSRQPATVNRTAQVKERKPVDYKQTAEPPRTSNRPAVEPVKKVTVQRNNSSTLTPKAPETSTVTRKAPETRTNVPRTTEARPLKTNKYTSEKYYSGRIYHNVYPAMRINVHHHHDTYVHHYQVLYYPAYHDIFWTRSMYRDYCLWYPNYQWRYNYGFRIQTISVFDAKYNMGEVAMVYGRVSGTWYNNETDDYLLFFGGEYPYHQFTVILPGNVARRFSWRPERYFLGEHMTVTGLITTYDGIPEIIVKNKRQVGLYW